jgi:putative intracellular protease/amidase
MPTELAILLYDRFTALDAIGPYEVLSRVPDTNVTFVAKTPGTVRTDTTRAGVVADRALDDLPAPDGVLVPGGPGQEAVMEDPEVLDWLRSAHEHTRWTTSVCTGSLVLAAAGLVEGRRATCHWLALERLSDFGAKPVAERVVVDGKLRTAAGVSAGIDMGLTLAAELADEPTAQAIQLGLEYDPQPPWDVGAPSKAPAAVVEFLRKASRHL